MIMDEAQLLKAAENFLNDPESRDSLINHDPEIDPTKLAALLGQFQARGTSQSIVNALNNLGVEAYNAAKRRGWYESRPLRPLERHALISSEVAEATEAVRDGVPRVCKLVSSSADPSVNVFADLTAPDFLELDGKPEGEFVELADAVIRIADYFGSAGLNLGDIVALKMEYNEKRAHRHGGKAC